jgi:MFS family permease
MDVARQGQSLAAALNHSTLNLANALGAWLGGLVLSHGLGYRWPSRVGGLLAVAGLLIALAAGWRERRTAASGTADTSSGTSDTSSGTSDTSSGTADTSSGTSDISSGTSEPTRVASSEGQAMMVR